MSVGTCNILERIRVLFFYYLYVNIDLKKPALVISVCAFVIHRICVSVVVLLYSAPLPQDGTKPTLFLANRIFCCVIKNTFLRMSWPPGLIGVLILNNISLNKY